MTEDPAWLTDPAFVRRSDLALHADPRRVLSKIFLPGQEILASGSSRADAVIQRVLAMTPAEVSGTLARTMARFSYRHHDLEATFAEHFGRLEHRVPQSTTPTPEQQQLIGAYCTQEYALEAAALFNPSMVAHPDQTGLAAGHLRFIMSVRAVGEGHVSSIEFRTGVLGPAGAAPGEEISVDEPGPHPVIGVAEPASMTRDYLRDALATRADATTGEHFLNLLPEEFDAGDLDRAFASVRRERLTRRSDDPIVERIRWIADCNYRLRFPPGRQLSERVIFPISPDESHGVEDARFTRFVNEDGSGTYYGTYTAFDGSRVAPHLIRTDDFELFEMSQLVGPAARDKGVALFPRLVGGKYLALSRWDRESIGVAASGDPQRWGDAVTVQAPGLNWDLIQLGNCGPPLETAAGWLVLTHGVGPMREYAIGAILLDLDEPTRLIGALRSPFLTPGVAERDGYVPNVLYSCGALVHGQTLVVPYGCSDSAIRFAFVDLPELLTRLQTG